MPVGDWFTKRTPLQLAIERGLKPGADLEGEIRSLGDYTVNGRGDAEAICAALERIAGTDVTGKKSIAAALHAVTGLFQDVENAECDAFPVLQERGTTRLPRSGTYAAALTKPATCSSFA